MTILSKAQLQAQVVSKDDSRKVLHGLYINHEETVSTDGKRILRVKHPPKRDDFVVKTNKESLFKLSITMNISPGMLRWLKN